MTQGLNKLLSGAQFNAEDFGAHPRSADNGPALRTAIATAVVAGGGTIFISPGTYMVSGVLTLSSSIRIVGAGIYATTLQQIGTVPNSQGLLYAESGGLTFLTAIGVADLTLDGQVATTHFDEWQHLLSLSGVKDVVIERVRFLGFRGDGLYLGSGYVSTEQHNLHVTVRDCVFDGVNRDNRNGISIIDGDGVLIEANYFTNCSRTTEPGAIDVEPNASYNVCRNITISNNKFIGNGGRGASIGFVFSTAASPSPSNFLVVDNEIRSADTPIDQGFTFVRAVDADISHPNGLVFARNRLVGCGRGMNIQGVYGALIEGNFFETTVLNPQIGIPGTVRKCIDVKILNNTFQNLDTSAGHGISIFTVDDLLISGNSFIDCGKVDGSIGSALDFEEGTSSAVRIVDNYFASPNHRTRNTIQKEAAHTFTPATNKFARNVMLTSGNYFVADDAPDLLIPWTSPLPKISGTVTAGTGTYTAQLGTYVRSGKLVSFNLAISWTAHTGTGQLTISAPPS